MEVEIIKMSLELIQVNGKMTKEMDLDKKPIKLKRKDTQDNL